MRERARGSESERNRERREGEWGRKRKGKHGLKSEIVNWLYSGIISFVQIHRLMSNYMNYTDLSRCVMWPKSVVRKGPRINAAGAV